MGISVAGGVVGVAKVMPVGRCVPSDPSEDSVSLLPVSE